MRIHNVERRSVPFQIIPLKTIPAHYYNGSLLRIGDRYLVACRTPGEETYAGFLDTRFQLIEPLHQIWLHQNVDPRLVWWKARPWMTTRYYGEWDYWRLELWPLTMRGEIDHSVFPENGYGHAAFMTVHDWPGYTRRREGNWTPFVEDGELYYCHTVCPHRILRFREETRSVHLVSSHDYTAISWRLNGGEGFRLNTPPARLPDGTWLSTMHYKIEENWYYYSGFYRFSPGPDWRVIEMSRAPILMPHHAIGNALLRPQKVIFLTGLEVVDDVVRLSGGSNDDVCVVIEMSLKDVLGHMKPIKET